MAGRARGVFRGSGLAASALAVVALAGAPATDQFWPGGEATVGLLSGLGDHTGAGDHGLAEPRQPDRGPARVECEWATPPRPDAELDIPDPNDYLILLDDGSYFLPDETVEIGDHELSLALLVDLLWIAGDEGISLEEAIFRFAWQERFAHVVTELQRGGSGRFAGAAIVDGGCGAWIAFNGPVPPGAAELVAQLSVPVELIGDRGYSEAELAGVLHEVFPRIAEHSDIVNASGWTDLATGSVIIHAQPASDTTARARAALCEALRPPPAANPAIEIRLILIEAAGSRTHPC